MGLDITHYKATIEKAEPHTLFYIGQNIYGETGAEIKEQFDHFNVDFNHFKKYIQKIEVPIEIESVIIVKGPENLNNVKEHFNATQKVCILKENEEQLQKELFLFEKQKGYENLKKVMDNSSHLNWSVLKYYTSEEKEGFYFKSVGEQRKGMNQKFWSKFCKGNHFNFALKKDFDYVFSCIDTYWDSDTKENMILRKEKFKKEFVDNYEVGTSFMSVSY